MALRKEDELEALYEGKALEFALAYLAYCRNQGVEPKADDYGLTAETAKNITDKVRGSDRVMC